MTDLVAEWAVSGSYFEVCNCEAICPCRSVSGVPGGRSTFGDCRFVLSWLITAGHAGDVELNDLAVVLAGWYDDDEEGSPWRVALYIDQRATDLQFHALSNIFLGRVGGATFIQFARAFGEIYHVSRADIELSHARKKWSIRVSRVIKVTAHTPVASNQPISCGIPGHNHPGQEVIVKQHSVHDGELNWQFQGRCGFATDFAYHSDTRASANV